MKIEYTYKIINVDKEAKSMEIVYESPKYGVLHVGARLPWKDETLEQIVEMYNPTRYWLEQSMEVLDVEENSKGSQEITVFDENAEHTDEKNIENIENIENNDSFISDKDRVKIITVLRETGLIL